MKDIIITDIPDSKDLQSFLEDFIHGENFAISVIYESIFWNTPKLRCLVENVLDMYNVDLKDRNRLVLVADELNNNAVEHGSGGSWDNIIDIRVKKQADNRIYFNIEVTDCGEWSATEMEELKKEKEISWFDEHHSIRGRGLFLITERIVDNLYFKDSDDWGLVVWVEKTL